MHTPEPQVNVRCLRAYGDGKMGCLMVKISGGRMDAQEGAVVLTGKSRWFGWYEPGSSGCGPSRVLGRGMNDVQPTFSLTLRRLGPKVIDLFVRVSQTWHVRTVWKGAGYIQTVCALPVRSPICRWGLC